MNNSEQIRHAFDELCTNTIQFREYHIISISDNSVASYLESINFRSELEIYFLSIQML